VEDGDGMPTGGTVCESTAAEAVDDMQRMNVADRRRTESGPQTAAARPTQRGRTKADHHTEGRTKRPTGGRRRTQTGNTQTRVEYVFMGRSQKNLNNVFRLVHGVEGFGVNPWRKGVGMLHTL